MEVTDWSRANMLAMSPRLAFALEAAYAAGRGTLAHFNLLAGYEVKADGSPLTIADRQAEGEIRRRIEQTYPGEAILGEEEGGKEEPGSRWVIDPIDGTKSFVCGVPLYGTLLSYEQDGRALLGVCYFPALDEVVYAERGYGAYWNGRPCRVSEVSSLVRATLCCGSHSSMHAHGRDQAFLKLAEQAMATRTWGDAYGHMLVATGRVEAMIDPVVKPWDLSAVSVIVEEAGGRCTDFRGAADPRYEAISSNGILHETLIHAFASE
jgi:histidinol-phosphatase